MRRAILFFSFYLVCITSIASPAQIFTTLVNFAGVNGGDGYSPYSGLVQATDGNLYGTTLAGGVHGPGTVFKITPSGTLTTLYSFCSQDYCPDGAEPYAGLVQANDGSFYGTTSLAGGNGVGTVFKITPSGMFTTLYSFAGYPSDGSQPWAGLVQASDGNLYGTTVYGGGNNNCQNNPSGCGTIFKITREGMLTTLYSFCAQAGCPDGSNPYAALIQASDGNFYGTTWTGGAHGGGTVFKISPSGTLTTLYSFCAGFFCSDGSAPYAALVQGTDGNFYGTTYYGGTSFNGTVFKITPEGALTTLYSFGFGPANPYAGLVQGTDGNFYGTTYGAYGDSAVFKITPEGALTTLHTFNYTDGRYPYGGLVQASDGNLYGTTSNGGANAGGTVFRLDAGIGVLLSVTKVGSGNVMSGDSYIDCGSTCSYTYKAGAAVTLAATPDQGWALAGWSGCDNSQGNVCTLTMNKLRSVTATFKLLYALSVSKSGNGTVTSGDGHIYCGNGCTYSYIDGTQVGLTAIPAPGYTFTNWAGCDNAHGSFCTITMSSAKNVTATFNTSNVGLSSLVLNPSSVKGGNISIATITLNAPAPSGGLGVGVASNSPLVVHPPSMVTIPPGATSYSFPVRTSAVRTKTVANVIASAGASQVNAMLTVTTGSGSSQEAVSQLQQ